MNRYLSLIITLLASATLYVSAQQTGVYTDKLGVKFKDKRIEFCGEGGQKNVYVYFIDKTGEGQPKGLSYWSALDFDNPNEISYGRVYKDNAGVDSAQIVITMPPNHLNTIVETQIVIESVYIGSFNNKHLYSTVSDTLLVSVYPIPHAKITTDDVVCSLDTAIQGEWTAMDHFEWTLSPNADEQVVGDTSSIKVRFNKSTDVLAKLKITRGPNCIDQTEKRIKFRTTPKGSFLHNDEVTDKKLDVRVCSHIDDPAAQFKCEFNIAGQYPPFNVMMSNGQCLYDVPNGKSYQEIFQPSAHRLHIDYIQDANGCHNAESDVEGMVNVVSRDPKCYTNRDTVVVAGETKFNIIAIEPDSYFDGSLYYADEDGVQVPWDEAVHGPQYEGNDIIWQFNPGSKAFDNGYAAWFETGRNATEPSTARGLYTSKAVGASVGGIIAFDYIEINNDGAECADTVTFYLKCDLDSLPDPNRRNIINGMSLPTGISPNGDGKNDVLIFEGIETVNEVIILNMNNEVVYQKKNYKNDWNADGVPDGYYIYIIKHKGTTTKQLFAIKRNKSL